MSRAGRDATLDLKPPSRDPVWCGLLLPRAGTFHHSSCSYPYLSEAEDFKRFPHPEIRTRPTWTVPAPGKGDGTLQACLSTRGFGSRPVLGCWAPLRAQSTDSLRAGQARDSPTGRPPPRLHGEKMVREPTPPALGTRGPQMPRRGFAVTHDTVLFEN